MRAHGTITAEMQEAGLAFHSAVLWGRPEVILQLGILGVPAGACAIAVLGLGRSLKNWARDGWQRRPIAEETASGILVGALAVLAYGKARLERALDRAAPGGPQA